MPLSGGEGFVKVHHTGGARFVWGIVLTMAVAGIPASVHAEDGTASAARVRPLNILLIVADDLREHGGAFAEDAVSTPNIDRLAAHGVRFSRAYAQYPVCNPSRTSLLVGQRCEQTAVVDNREFFRDRLPDAITFPELLRRNGWTTRSFGKVMHAGNTVEALRPAWLDEGRSWDHAEILPAMSPHRRGEFRNLTGGVLPWCEVGILDGDDGEQPDARTATAAVAAIEDLRKDSRPWLIAVGFHRPHDPFHAPRRYFDRYPSEAITPYRDPVHASPLPPLAITGSRKEFAAFSDDDRRALLQAYCAGVSFMDAQVGRLLDALDRNSLWPTTLVVFLGDHGYHLGERDWWNKATLFERSCRAPLIIASPDGRHGARCEALVEFVDLFPTITECGGVRLPGGLAGKSICPLLADPSLPHKDAAFSMVVRNPSRFGQTVRTDRWRLIAWSDGALELYDHQTDPEETLNLAGDPAAAEVVKRLRRRLDDLPPWPP